MLLDIYIRTSESIYKVDGFSDAEKFWDHFHVSDVIRCRRQIYEDYYDALFSYMPKNAIESIDIS